MYCSTYYLVTLYRYYKKIIEANNLRILDLTWHKENSMNYLIYDIIFILSSNIITHI